jgi:carbamoyl-phosphate synthase large subunit
LAQGLIGQAGEFYYAAFQICGALKQEGYQVVIVNSNPITLTTDLAIADVTYIEPLTPDNLERIIGKTYVQSSLSTKSR